MNAPFSRGCISGSPFRLMTLLSSSIVVQGSVRILSGRGPLDLGPSAIGGGFAHSHSMSYSNRIWIYGPVGLLLLVVVLYSVFWRVQADMLAARLDSANGGEIVPGVVFAFAEKSVGGFPFRLDAVLSGVTFTDRHPDGETAWRTERMAIHTLAYRTNLYVLEVDGLQSFARPGERGEPPQVLYITPALARASAVLRDGRLARFDLDLRQLNVKDARAQADQKRTFSAARAQFHALVRPDETIDVAL